MALELNIDLCVSDNCETLYFTETTGTYSGSNLTGWGAPNATIASVTVANLIVTDPDLVQYTIDLLATTYFPTTDTTYQYTIPVTSIGLNTGDVITDGQWKFTYYVVADDVVYTVDSNKLFYCNSKCCVTGMLADIDSDACECNKTNSKLIDNYKKASVFLAVLIDAAICGKTTKFANIKKIVDKLCLNSDCKTCN